jgi:hypothetical protein
MIFRFRGHNNSHTESVSYIFENNNWNIFDTKHQNCTQITFINQDLILVDVDGADLAFKRR